MSKTKATGVVAGNPVIAMTKGGVETGNLFVQIEGVGRAKVFFDDPHSDHMFSFQDGDEVDVEWWNKGQWLNASILTPKGTADPEEQLEQALKVQSGDGLLDVYARTIIACRVALQDSGLEETIEQDVTLDAAEETFRTASMGMFIELNRKGVDLNGLLGE